MSCERLSDEVEVVASHLAQELDPLGDLQTGDLRWGRGQQVGLDSARPLYLGSHLRLRRSQLVVQLGRGHELLLEAGDLRAVRHSLASAHDVDVV